MSQIWGVIEGIQIVSYLQLFNAKIPANVQTFLGFFDEITSFEVLPAEEWTDEMLYAPESVPPSINFQQAGHDSTLVVKNLGSTFYIWIGIMCLFGFYFLVLWPLRSLCPKVEKKTAKLRNLLFWGGTSRFFIESYMQITLYTLLNLKEFEWDTDFPLITLSDVFAIVSLAAIVTLPIVLVIFLACNMDKWDDKEFAARNGALLDGADLDRESSQWIVLLIPMSYFLRRMLMCLTLVFWIDFIWGQLAI